MSYREHIVADRRLCLVRALSEEPNGTLNETSLQRAAEAYGHHVSVHAIKADLRWLADVDAVTVVEVAGYLVATLTALGEDHAQHRTIIKGIARPRLD